MSRDAEESRSGQFRPITCEIATSDPRVLYLCRQGVAHAFNFDQSQVKSHANSCVFLLQFPHIKATCSKKKKKALCVPFVYMSSQPRCLGSFIKTFTLKVLNSMECLYLQQKSCENQQIVPRNKPCCSFLVNSCLIRFYIIAYFIGIFLIIFFILITIFCYCIIYLSVAGFSVFFTVMCLPSLKKPLYRQMTRRLICDHRLVVGKRDCSRVTEG